MSVRGETGRVSTWEISPGRGRGKISNSECQLYVTNTCQGYTVFSIPVGVVYRPNQAKVKNLKTKDYLGKARLVAASDRSNAFTGFAGSEIKNVSIAEQQRSTTC